jgi:two-component system, OmpR family, sensor histidine kinase CpxA
MRSLSLKLFLGFWLTNLLLLITLCVSYLAIGPNPMAIIWKEFVANTAGRLYAHTAVEVYESEGSQGLASLLTALEKEVAFSTYLFTSDHKELSDRSATPVEIADALKEASRENGLLRHAWDRVLIVEPVKSRKGTQYFFVALAPTALAKTLKLTVTPSLLLARLLAVFLPVLLVTYFVARYLTSPLVEFRSLARRFATGAIDTRARGSLVERRDEVGDLARDFNNMASRIEELLEAHKTLLADVSHELRSPLARLNVALALARNAEPNALEKALDRAEMETDRVNALIESLLTLNRLDAGVELEQQERLDLSSLLSEVARDARFEAMSLNKHVEVILPESVLITGRPKLLHSAIENIVRNGLKYTPEGTAIKLSLLRNAEEIVIAVRDHGPGVPKAQLETIFKPFAKASNTDPHKKGFGLGLAIAERAIRHHNGRVEATNHPEGGLVVRIHLRYC